MILERIHSREDLLALTREEDEQLCREIRQFLIEHVSQTGGHLASNLGIVETTLAIQKAFDTSRDRLVFDVGHQSYVHKILTGRMDRFSTLRSFGGLSGFPKPSESVHDAFIAGHASNAVPVALGMARARTLRGEDHRVIALLGDGALTGGMPPRDTLYFDTPEATANALSIRARKGDTILFKGSRGMRMEQIIELFLAEN